MKRFALLLAVLMVMGSVTGWCGMNAAVDSAVDIPRNSDISVVEDSGHLLHLTNDGVEKTYNTVTEPMEPGLKHVRKLKDETMKHTKMVLNKAWDLLTFKDHRRE